MPQGDDVRPAAEVNVLPVILVIQVHAVAALADDFRRNGSVQCPEQVFVPLLGCFQSVYHILPPLRIWGYSPKATLYNSIISSLVA